jgi:hypothetical protein
VSDECDRAAKGFAWIAVEGPKYGLDVNRLDPETLDLGDPTACALAQAVGGTFSDAAIAIGLYDAERGNRPWLIEHGFYGTPDGFVAEYRRLTEAWIAMITVPLAPEPLRGAV